jgi:hypothetical protein
VVTELVPDKSLPEWKPVTFLFAPGKTPVNLAQVFEVWPESLEPGEQCPFVTGFWIVTARSNLPLAQRSAATAHWHS